MHTLQVLEKKLGYTFRCKEQLQAALYHSSYANEHRCCGVSSNERLEFLGDAVLGLVTADYLYHKHPDLPEGDLTRMRAALVCEESLYEVAQRLGLGSELRLGKGEEAGGGRQRPSILADATESVFAAVYLDGGMEAARALIHRVLLDKEQEEAVEERRRDYKTELQELVQRRSNQTLHYEMIGATGLLLGIALAMYRRVDADKRKNYRSMFISTALAVFLTGVTEPLEFMFMFCAMPLYIVYAILQGCAFAMAGIIHLRLHSFGNLEFITRIPMSLQAGLGGDIVNFVICVVAFFIIGYFVAYFMIGKLNLATPGRLGNYTDDNAPDEDASGAKAEKKSDNGQAERIIALLGGRENIVLVDACMTRLRVTVKDPAKVADLAAWKAEGALSLLVKGDGIQAVYGPKADVLKSDINDIL